MAGVALSLEGGDAAAAGGGGDAAGGGGAAAPPPKKVAKPVVPKVYYTVADRGNKKHVTKVVGLEAYLPPTTKLKEAASALGKRFGAGATVSKATNNPAILEIDIQGDVSDDLPDVLALLFKVPGNAIKEG